jgi:hypothetical protein
MCNWVVCADCQRTYAKSECSSCHSAFRHKFIIDYLGTDFISKIVKPSITNNLLTELKSKLHIYEPFVQWELDFQKAHKQKRFGIKIEVPPRPTISSISKTDNIFACPYTQCRGFIKDKKCGLCNGLACMLCHEKWVADHVCKKEDLQSLAIINSDSKPCPKCRTKIHRTMGCDHMFCTNCHTHFHWRTGEIMGNSTNQHYAGLRAFTTNVQTINNANTHNITCDNLEFSLYNPKVSLDNIPNQNRLSDIIHVLYNDANTIRLMKRKLYDENHILDMYNEQVSNAAIKYLMNKTNETQLGRSLYNYFTQNRLKNLYANILNIYLTLVDSMQLLLLKPECDFEYIRHTMYNGINLCNESFNSVCDEYGGERHHIRNIDENIENPAWL